MRVNTHDFPSDSVGKAVPYGIYDITANTGWVNVGTDHDTAAFAVESIRRWWHTAGAHDYPGATRLLITADAGGSNGYRSRTWKAELADLAAETGLAVTVCHRRAVNETRQLLDEHGTHITAAPTPPHTLVNLLAATITQRNTHP